MLKIRNVLIVPIFTVFSMLVCSIPSTSAAVQVGIGIGLPNVSIGINLPAYPELVAVPGYPVYYAPRLRANFFFYDGLYWVYQDGNWYESSWYNGPWWIVEPEFIPVFILRVPVRYYRHPPVYFSGWQANRPPRWGDHWGHDWEQRRSGWDRWDRRSAPAPAPLPTYQRRYSGDRYPQQMEQQQALQQRNYRYQPRDPVVRQQYQERQQSHEQRVQKAPAQQENFQQDRPRAPEDRGSMQQDRRTEQRMQSPQRDGGEAQRPMPPPQQQGRPEVQDRRQQPPQRVGPQDIDQQGVDRQGVDRQGAVQHEQQAPRSQDRQERQHGKETMSDSKSRQEQDRGRGRDHNDY